MILLNAAESRELDRLSRTRYGIDSYTLMTRAGEAVAESVARHSPAQLRDGVTIVAGKGNNGGDGFVAARKLHQQGARTNVLLLASMNDLRGDAARACDEYRALGGRLSTSSDTLPSLEPAGVIIDAVFGSGLNAPVHGLAAQAIAAANQRDGPVIAIDLPSGVNADTGAVMGVAIRATRTITFGFAKYGHVSYPGAEYCGDLEIADIGFAPRAIDDVAPKGSFIEMTEAARIAPQRGADTHKGTYGHVLIIAGARGKSGAALLASRGALHAGAGLVTAAIPESVSTIVAAGQAELMTEPMPDRDGGFDADATIEALQPHLEGKNALVVGPGMGLNADTIKIVEWLLREGARTDRPLVIDADGLNALAQRRLEVVKNPAALVVLTPHPGEMARLLKSSTAAVNADRVGAARALAQRTGWSIVLKGARSIIAAPQGELAVNSSGNPGMAAGGMGDVLSGIIGALLAQGLASTDALKLGVFVHGRAADRLARTRPFGYPATAVAAELPYVFAELELLRRASHQP